MEEVEPRGRALRRAEPVEELAEAGRLALTKGIEPEHRPGLPGGLGRGRGLLARRLALGLLQERLGRVALGAARRDDAPEHPGRIAQNRLQPGGVLVHGLLGPGAFRRRAEQADRLVRADVVAL